MTQQEICPICGADSEGRENSDLSKSFTCINCGKYNLHRYIVEILDGKSYFPETQDIEVGKARAMLFYYLRVVKSSHQNKEKYLMSIYWKSDSQSKYNINFSEIYYHYPRNFTQKLNMAMELLSTKITDLGEMFPCDFDDRTICAYFLPSKESDADRIMQSNAMLKYLLEAGLIEQPHYINQTKKLGFSFSQKGWEYVDSLRKSADSNTVFIAMSFNKDDARVEQAMQAIKEAIGQAGYMPILINEKEHNNFIMNEIFYEIKKSAFVIADLTTQNHGAYFEAGYAKALDKEVIFTCHADDFDKIHFDTKQINTIKWDDTKKLTEDILRRIEVSIGKR